MFFSRANIAHDTHKVVCAGLCTEAAGNLLLHLGKSDTALSLIICERYRPIRGKPQDVGFIVSKPLKKAAVFPFCLAATFALWSFLYGIGFKPFGYKRVIPLKVRR